MSMRSSEQIERILDDGQGLARDALIPLLQRIQEAEGYLSQESLARVGGKLGLSVAKVYGVATFYNQFRFAPRGRYHLMLCRGTACHVKGSKKLLETITARLGIEPGQTTRDRLFSLEVVACMGACALSPVLSINDVFHAKVSPGKARSLIEACIEESRSAVPAPQGA
jgi:NADH:ubiquinone oxidoreductase subunit E